MQRAFASEAEQRAARDALEAMLRQGRADDALAAVRARMARVGPGSRLIDLALAARPEQVTVSGWDEMAETIAALETRGKIITALGIDFSWPGHIGLEPDAAGRMDPYIETNYYADLSDVAFSKATRAELLAGYSRAGSRWQGCFAEIDNTIAVGGMGALYGAVAGSEDRSGNDAAGDAHTLAAATSAILVHLAVRRMIATRGLPKPMAVIVGSNEDFPFFDAPVVAVDEARALMPEKASVAAARPMPAPLSPAALPESPSGSALRSRLALSAGDPPEPRDASPPKGFFAKWLGR